MSYYNEIIEVPNGEDIIEVNVEFEVGYDPSIGGSVIVGDSWDTTKYTEKQNAMIHAYLEKNFSIYEECIMDRHWNYMSDYV